MSRQRTGVSWPSRAPGRSRQRAGLVAGGGSEDNRIPNRNGPAVAENRGPDGDAAAGFSSCPWCSDEPALHRMSHVLCDRCRSKLMREAAEAVLVVASAPAMWVCGAFLQEIAR